MGYDDLFKFGLALTNLYGQWQTLCDDGNKRYQRARNRLLHISNDQIEKRRYVFNHYQGRRRAIFRLQFRNPQCDMRPSILDFPEL